MDLKVEEVERMIDNRALVSRSACTIYKRTNKVNGKVYVGQTWQTVEERAGTNGRHYKNSTHFWHAIQQVGWDKIETEEICSCLTQEDADFCEDYFQALYDSYNPEKGYNIRKDGSRGQHSELTKQRMSIAAVGKIKSEEHRKNMSESRKGKKASKETKAKMSENHKFAKFTWDQIRYIRDLYFNHNKTKSDLARMFGVDRSTMSRIIDNKTWKDIK
jgi:group I intron endonuclease